jgi:hypothetical protein
VRGSGVRLAPPLARWRDAVITRDLPQVSGRVRREFGYLGWCLAGSQGGEDGQEVVIPAAVARLVGRCPSPAGLLHCLKLIVHAQNDTANELRKARTHDSVSGMRNQMPQADRETEH